MRKLEDQTQFRQAQRENDVSFVLVAEDDTSDLQVMQCASLFPLLKFVRMDERNHPYLT